MVRRVVLVATTAVLLAGCSLPGPPRATPPTGAGPSAAATELAGLTVVPTRPSVPGYDRDCGPGDGCVFGPAWADVDHNGCDQRNDVLRAQLTDVVLRSGTDGCVVASGTLHDPYTATTIAFVRGPDSDVVQIDHVVPLALAWDLGAATWTAAQRQAFANDTTVELLAVSGSANQSKGDDGPAAWQPPNAAFRCDYARAFATVLSTYRLSVVAADRDALGAALRSC